MDIPAPPMDVNEPIVIAIDSSGVKVTNKGEWMRKKWRGDEYKGWMKVHVAVDVRSKKIMAMEVMDERTADYTSVPSLIDQIESNGGKVKRVLADGAYYYNTQTYNLLEVKRIDAGTRMRKDARTRAIGSPYKQDASAGSGLSETLVSGSSPLLLQEGYLASMWCLEGLI